MIDINKLLASLKRRSSHIKEFCDDITFVKLEDLDALVEALDKAQETIAFQQGEIKALLSSLESRTVTVKLPSLNPAMFNGDVMFGYHKAQKEAVEFCAAAGIKVEAE